MHVGACTHNLAGLVPEFLEGPVAPSLLPSNLLGFALSSDQRGTRMITPLQHSQISTPPHPAPHTYPRLHPT